MKKKTLTEFEWQIMEIIWKKNSGTVRNVFDEIIKKQDRAYTTVQTYMERLVKKNYLQKEKNGGVNIYFPTIKRAAMQKQETKSLINKVFNGSFTKMAASLFDLDSVTDQEMDQIKQLLEEKETNDE